VLIYALPADYQHGVIITGVFLIGDWGDEKEIETMDF
jgi:hypothetical protein